MTECEKLWEEFWVPFLIEKGDGYMLEQVKKELFDYYFLLLSIQQGTFTYSLAQIAPEEEVDDTIEFEDDNHMEARKPFFLSEYNKRTLH